jgi:hypothetical protein
MNKTPENFKDHPQSVADYKSDKSHNAADWSARDMLISALRDIDNGTVVMEAAILVWRDGHDGVGYSSASLDPFVTCSLFTYGKQLFLNPVPAIAAFAVFATGWLSTASDIIVTVL